MGRDWRRVLSTLSKFNIGGVITDKGALEIDRDLFRRLTCRMGRGLRVTVTVEEEREKRPNWLSRFYWGFIIAPTAEHCGYTKDEMHEAWKMAFLKLEDADHPLPTVRSTTDLAEDEMREYIQNIRIAAAQMWGVELPEINEHMEVA